MHTSHTLTPRRGIALITTILVVLAVIAVASGTAYLSLNTSLIAKYHSRLSVLEAAADAGLEETRSWLNAASANFPVSGYTTRESNATVTDASGAVIPGVKRWIYVGPTGLATGQFGVYGSVVVVVQDASNNRIVRRMEVVQESFARYAYFTNVEGGMVFYATDVIYGPVHSNDVITISNACCATFWGHVKTAMTITNLSKGRFNGAPSPGYQQNSPVIPFPVVADLNALLSQATMGGTNFTSSTAGAAGQASMRIEFVPLDLNADGDSTDADEGFMKIYNVANTANAWWVVADTQPGFNTNTTAMRTSLNCGHILTSGTGSHATFKVFKHHTNAGTGVSDDASWAVLNGTSRYCYLGGSNILNDKTSPPGQFLATDSLGSWQAYPGTVDSRVTTARPADAGYLWPISRTLNPNFKGVIHVTGKVAISGKVRGAITLAATGNIIIADNVTYVSNPGGTVPCNSPARDILGLFSGVDVLTADNLINAQMSATGGSLGTYRAWGNRTTSAFATDEVIHASVLAIRNFTVENFNRAPNDGDRCNGGGALSGSRGCLRVTGGIIQATRGAVGAVAGAGYTKIYDYDKCSSLRPPPYFPTTGRFSKGHYYEVEPTNFNIATYWATLIP